MFYLYPFAQTGREYIKVPKQNEAHIVTMTYAYALQGCLLSLIALNSEMKVETVLRQPKKPNCTPVTMILQVLVFTYRTETESMGSIAIRRKHLKKEDHEQ